MKPFRSWPNRVCPALIFGLAAGCATFNVERSTLNVGAATVPSDQPEALQQPKAPALPRQESDSPFAGMKELKVDTLVEQVLARNPSLAQMVAAWQAARARYPQVTSLDDPMFAGTIGPGTIAPDDPVEFASRVEISQKYPWPGKLALRGRNALAEASAAGGDVEDVRLQLIEAAKNAFYEYYLVGRALAVNEESLELFGKSRRSAQIRYKNTQTKVPEQLQFDVEIGRAQERRLTLQRRRQVAVARINTLLHLPADTPVPPPPEQLTLAGALPPVEELRSRALTGRPDLRALADRIAAEEASLALACKEFYPDFEPFFMYDRFMGNSSQNRDLASMLGVKVNLPVRWARRQAAVAEAQARLAQRRAELASRTDQVNLQVQEAYEQVLESEKTVQLYEKTILPAARQNEEAVRPHYTTGDAPLLNLLEAQRNLVSLRDRYYEALADYYRRRATLERTIGGALAP